MSRAAFLLFGLAAVTSILMQSAGPARAAENSFIMASTTSTVNSGLFKSILPLFTARTGIAARVLGVGTGQAIRIAERGDADVLFVHHRESELAFVQGGFGVKRHDVMFNDFVVVGPAADAARVGSAGSASRAYRKIAAARSIFVSRGDDSGTHRKSLAIWRRAGVEVKNFSGRWYREAGAGMGATLNIATSMEAYTLTDRATWEAFRNKGSHRILYEGGPGLKNQYGVILVNPARHRHIRVAAARAFIDWVLSDAGQAAIDGFRINGKQIFFANGRRAGGGEAGKQ